MYINQGAVADPELSVRVRRQREIQTVQLQSEGALPNYKHIFGINKSFCWSTYIIFNIFISSDETVCYNGFCAGVQPVQVLPIHGCRFRGL